MMNDIEHSPPDGGWGWRVVAASFVARAITEGTVTSIGVFYVSFLNQFQQSKSTTAWVGSLLIGALLISGLFAGFLINSLGSRKVTIIGATMAAAGLCFSILARNVFVLYATVGIITGFGLGFPYLASLVIVNKYFHKYRGVAVGLAVSGSGFGTFVLPPICDQLITHLGWKLASVVLAAIIFTLLNICAVVFRPLHEKNNADDLEGKDDSMEAENLWQNFDIRNSVNSVKEHLKMAVHYWRATLFIICALLGAVGIYNPYVYIVDYGLSLGLSSNRSSILISVIGITNLIGRILTGFISTKLPVSPIWLSMAAYFTAGVCNVLYALCRSYTSFCIVSSIFGLCCGCLVSVESLSLVEIVGMALLSPTYGVYYFFVGVASLLAIPGLGWMVDHFQDYTNSFYTSGAIMCLGALVTLPVCLSEGYRPRCLCSHTDNSHSNEDHQIQ